MDDANLAKLTLSQPGLEPLFNKETLTYTLTVPSNVDQLKLSAVTSDKGASFSIKSDTGYGEEVKLNNGANRILIEVTSEDGTVKKYTINCVKLSPSEAKIKRLEFTPAHLMRQFDPNELDYSCSVDSNLADVKAKLELFDTLCSVEVFANEAKIDPNPDGFFHVGLNYGFSNVVFKLTSPDKSNTQSYSVRITRAAVWRLSTYVDVATRYEYEDLISLAPIYMPILVDSNAQLVYSAFFEFFRKIASSDRVNIISLSADSSSSSSSSPKLSMLVENKLSNALVKVPYLNGAFSKEIPLRNLSQLVEEANRSDKLEPTDEVKNFKPPSNWVKPMPDSLPSYQAKAWEKHLQIIYDEKDTGKLSNTSNFHFGKYLELKNSLAQNKAILKDEHNSPMDHLNKSIFNLATCLKYKSNDYQIHYRLAILLTEKSLFESVFGTERKQNSDENKITLTMQNKIAAESSKEEEIDAICKARNVASNASDVEKLKAIDDEYHHLIETNQHAKAEQVQLLYQFKAKRAVKDEKVNKTMNENSDCLFQANMKLIDSVSLILESRQTNFNMYFSLGRSFCQIGDFAQALVFLSPCINWSDVKFQCLSRFYFGFALYQQTDSKLDESSANVIVNYLINGLTLFLENLGTDGWFNTLVPFGEDYLNFFNVEFIEAFVLIAENAFKYCSLLCCLVLNEVNKKAPPNRDVLKTSKLLNSIVEILIESHLNLIQTQPNTKELINENDSKLLKSTRCANLVSLIRSSTFLDRERILLVQEQVCEMMVFATPQNAYYLLLLGCSKLDLYDFLNELTKSDENLPCLLDEAKVSLCLCEDLINGKWLSDTSLTLLQDQKWWKKLKTEQEASTKRDNSAKRQTSASNKSIKQQPSVSVKPVTTTATKVQTVTKTMATKNTTPAKPAVNNVNKKPTVNKPNHTHVESKKVEAKVSPTPQQESKPQEPEQKQENSSSKVGIKIKETLSDCFLIKSNIETQLKLYLARVYARLKDFEKSKFYYQALIKKKPNENEAYIELAEMLKGNQDYAGAIEVYSSFPIQSSQNAASSNDLNTSQKEKTDQTFDDAFIYGELVTLLMKAQMYDDARLTKYLILWAKIMGPGIIEKYITILDKANKTKCCKEVYAGIHNKKVDDADLVQFFKFKGWF